MPKEVKIRAYKGYSIYPHYTPNPSGLRWYAIGREGYLKADTLAGIKKLIAEDKSKG